jgi:UDP-N-acetyl-D-mannosaminuronate dehydrogenase
MTPYRAARQDLQSPGPRRLHRPRQRRPAFVCAFAQNDFPVLNFDLDSAKVHKLNAGQSSIRQIPAADARRMRNFPHHRMTSRELTPEFLAARDCVLIATDHSAYDYGLIVRHARLVVDTRYATRGVASGREKIVRA